MPLVICITVFWCKDMKKAAWLFSKRLIFSKLYVQSVALTSLLLLHTSYRSVHDLDRV